MAVIYSEQNTDLGSGHYMESQAWLNSDDGTLTDIAHTWCTNWVIGFTGAWGVLLFDTNGAPLNTDIPVEWPLGIDARGVFFKPSSRTDTIKRQVDPNIAHQTGSILIVHSHVGKDRVQEWLNQLKEWRGSFDEFCQTFPEACAGLHLV